MFGSHFIVINIVISDCLQFLGANLLYSFYRLQFLPANILRVRYTVYGDGSQFVCKFVRTKENDGRFVQLNIMEERQEGRHERSCLRAQLVDTGSEIP